MCSNNGEPVASFGQVLHQVEIATVPAGPNLLI
jgi:hypothetical protein